MDNTREKLIELLETMVSPKELLCYGEVLVSTSRVADHLVANGVTFATDNNVGDKWIPVTERLPEISALDKEWSKTVLFRTTRGYIFSGYRCVGRPQKSFYDDDWTPPYWLNESEELEFEDDEVTHWMPLPEPPKED